MPIALPDGWRGEVVDLSATGLRIRTLAIIPRHTELEGSLELPDGRKVAVKGTVMWFTPPDHARGIAAEMGVQLKDASAEYLALVAAFFAEQG